MVIRPWVPSIISDWPAEVALLLVEGKGSEKQKEQNDSKGPEPTVPGPIRSFVGCPEIRGPTQHVGKLVIRNSDHFWRL